MSCYRPLEAVQEGDGRVVVGHRTQSRVPGRPLSLPCGKCIGCLISRQRAWAIRCWHESQMHAVNSFVTLTYNDPCSPSLNYSDFQQFIKALRLEVGHVRYFVAGEYGAETHRPHFHALLFGVSFPNPTCVGKDIFSSPLLTSLWPSGFSSFGAVTHQSAAYVAGYVLKKRLSASVRPSLFLDLSTGETCELVPEFCHMSRRPGIGYTWFQKYWREVYLARDGICLPGGFTVPSPRYYDKLLLALDSDLREYKDYERYVRSARFVEDSSPARLLARETVAIGKYNFFNRRGL